MPRPAYKIDDYEFPARKKLKLVPQEGEENPTRPDRPHKASRKNRRRRGQSQTRSRNNSQPSQAKWVIIVKIVLVFLIAALLIGHLLSSNQLSVAQEEVGKLNEDIASLEAERDALKMDIAPYIEESRLEKLAVDRLHMIKPDQKRVIAAEKNQQSIFKDDTTRLAERD